MAERIPVFENNLITEPIDLRLSGANINSQIEKLNESVQKSTQEVLNMSMQDSSLKYQNLAQKEIRNAFEAHPSDPVELQKALNEKQKSLMRGVPLGLRQQATQWFSNNTRGIISESRSNEIKVLANSIRKESLDTVDFNQKQIRMFSGNMLSDDLGIAEEASIGAMTAFNNILSTLKSTGPRGLPIYTADQQVSIYKESIVGLITSGISQKFNSLNIEDKRVFLDKYINNKISMPIIGVDGQKSEIIPTNELTTGQYNALGNSLSGSLRAAEVQQKKLEKKELQQKVLMGTAIADPADPEYREIVNETYQDLLRPALTEAPLKQRVTLMMEYVKSNEMIPDVMQAEIGAWVQSGDEQQLRTAVAFISQAKIQFPRALIGLNNATTGKAFAIQERLAAGVSYEEAKAYGDNLYSPQTREVYQARSKEFTEHKQAKNFDWTNGAAESIKKGWGWFGIGKAEFPEDTIIGEQAGRDYKTMFETNYVLSRDWDKAKELTDAQFSFRWGLSEANGNKVTLYPAERMYKSEGLDPLWVKTQLIETVTRLNKEGNLNIDPESAILQTDFRTLTEIENKIPPTYGVLARDNSGLLTAIKDANGDPVRIRPDLNRATKEHNVQLAEDHFKQEEKRKADPRLSAIDMVKFMGLKRANSPEILAIRKGLKVITESAKGMRNEFEGDDDASIPRGFPFSVGPKRVTEKAKEFRREKFLR